MENCRHNPTKQNKQKKKERESFLLYSVLLTTTAYLMVDQSLRFYTPCCVLDPHFFFFLSLAHWNGARTLPPPSFQIVVAIVVRRAQQWKTQARLFTACRLQMPLPSLVLKGSERERRAREQFLAVQADLCRRKNARARSSQRENRKERKKKEEKKTLS